ncbi:MAG: 30S ribosomal protein S10 [Nanopusillaceae archaeon]
MYLRIKIWGTKLEPINSFTSDIIKIVEQLGIEKRGPINLPTKVLRVPSMRTLGKRGTKIYETYQMKIYRRFIDVAYDDRFIKNFLRLQIPPDVKLLMKVVKK